MRISRSALPALLPLIASLWMLAGPTTAEVIAAEQAGFEVREHVTISAPPSRVWAAIVNVGSWWSPDHTYSKQAANLSLTPEAGGCFCERWADGSVRHMTVALAEPQRSLRLEGALGPLGGLGVVGHLSFALAPNGQGTDLDVTYDVGGWSKDGLQHWAAPVDHVMDDQVQRLSRYVENGAP